MKNKRNKIHSSKLGLNVNYVGVADSVCYAKYENDVIKKYNGNSLNSELMNA